MKKIISFILLLLVIGGTIFLSSYYLIIPGIKKYNEANKIVILTADELSMKRDEIINEYNKLEEDLNNKYINLNSALDKEYSDLEAAVRNKYDQMETEIRSKYTKKMGEDGWYDEQVQMQKEISALSNPKSNELSSLYSEKSEKKSNLFFSKSKEESELNNKEENELNSITNNASNKLNAKLVAFIYIIGGILILIYVFIINIKMINKLVKFKNNVKNSWSQVDVLLKQRYDMIPNILSTVKGYSKYEKSTLDSITKLRESINNNSSQNNIIKANYKLNQDIEKILLLKEAYPELKANSNYVELQKELLEIENKIADARTNYNNNVLKYQNTIMAIPTNLWASILNYKEEPYFGIKDTERENIDVNFN